MEPFKVPVLDSTSHHLDISQDDYEPATYSALDCTEGQLLSLKQKYVRQFQQFKQEHLRGANSRLLRLDKIIQHTAELNHILSSATSITGQTGQDQSEEIETVGQDKGWEELYKLKQ